MYTDARNAEELTRRIQVTRGIMVFPTWEHFVSNQGKTIPADHISIFKESGIVRIDNGDETTFMSISSVFALVTQGIHDERPK